MKTEDYLKKIKREYLSVEPSQEFENFGWDNLELSSQNIAMWPFRNYISRAVLVAGVIIVFLASAMFGLIQLAQASLPGEPLYPLKRLYENIIFNKPEQKKEQAAERVDEIIEAVNRKKDKKTIERSIDEYKKTIEEAKKGVSGHDRDDLRKSVEEQEERIKKEIKGNAELKKEIEKATNTFFEEGKVETKGAATQQKDEDKSGKNTENAQDDNESKGQAGGR